MRELTYGKVFSRMGLLYLLLMVFAQFVGAGMMILCSIFWPWMTETGWFLWAASYVPLYLVGVPVFFALLKRLVPADDAFAMEQYRMSPGECVRMFVVLMGAVYIFNIVSVYITMGIGALKGAPVDNPLEAVTGGSGMLYNVLFGCIVAPIGEELVFRWAPYRRIAVRFGERSYLLYSSFVFALYHGNLSQLLYAFVVGWLLGYIYIRTGNLRCSIGFHMAVNVVGMLVGPALAGLGTAGTAAAVVLEAVMIGGCLILWSRMRTGVVQRPGREAMPAQPVRAALLNPGNVGLVLFSALIIAAATLM